MSPTPPATPVRPNASRPSTIGPVTGWILRPKDPAPLELWGLTPEERLRRQLAHAGCEPIVSVEPDHPPRPPRSGTLVVVRADVVTDARLVDGLAARPGTLLVAPPGGASPGEGVRGAVAGHVVAAHAAALVARLRDPDTSSALTVDGVQTLSPSELASDYVPALRKTEPPLLLPARPVDARHIEARLFAASYKSLTDLVTKWIWPAPAARVTRVLALRGVPPNAVTLANWGLALLATLLFAGGHFGAGLLAGWTLTFLDTVDGKLARVTLRSSRVGHVLDHGLDIVHPPFWYLAWGLGLGAGHEGATALAVGGYVAGRLLELAFLLRFGIDCHVWRPADALFRTITARRNPNLLLLSVAALGGRPDLGLVMVGIWTVASIGFHSTRLVQALARARRGEEIRSWLEPA